MRALRTGCLLGIAIVSTAGAQDSLDAPIPHDSGQSVSPVYEGWYPNPDGTFTLSFGYFNRNTEEVVEIEIGRFTGSLTDLAKRQFAKASNLLQDLWDLVGNCEIDFTRATSE